jgi:hypothetical protein
MSTLAYPRHLLLLGAGALALAVVPRLEGLPGKPLFHLLTAAGVLHATAVVLALRARASWPAAIGFVAAAAAAPVVAFFGAFALVSVVRLGAVGAAYLGLASLAAVGATLYWLLVRGCWARALPWRHLALTVAVCVAATLVAELPIVLLGLPHDVVVVLAWWLAFSVSLRLAER